MQNYKIQNIIGQGAFGNAYLATCTRDNKHYVVKKIQLNNKNQQETNNIFNQVKLLEQFKHVNIVSYRQSIIEGQWLNIIMEFCDGGDLNNLITYQRQTLAGQKIQQKKIIDWAVQISLAIFYMHDKRILHRDIKTPNIFIINQKVKLGDFGISKVLDQKVDLASTSIGTPYYMSPQQYRHKPYSYKSDIWAFGCILYQMCNLKRPFQAMSLNGLAVKVMQANYPPISEYYSKDLRQLIKKMLQKKQKQRPLILQVLQTPIFKKRAIVYLKQVYQKMMEQNGDKVLLQGVISQAKKLGINLFEDESKKKTKQQFSAQKKKQQKQKMKLQLQEQLKKISQQNKRQKQQLKRLTEDRKIIKKGNNDKLFQKKGIAGSSSSKSIKQPIIDDYKSKKSNVSASTKSNNSKQFEIKQKYDMYQMEYEEEDSNDDIQEVDQQYDQEIHHKNQAKITKHQITKIEEQKPQPKIQIKAEPKVQPKLQPKIQAKIQQKQETKIQSKQQTKQQIKPQPKIEQKVQSKSTKANKQKIKEEDMPIEQKIINLKQSLKQNNQKLNTLKNQLSNIDFDISSSDDQFKKTMYEQQLRLLMKKKQKNPLYVIFSDKINSLKQNLQMLFKKQMIQQLFNLRKSKGNKASRQQIQKITGDQKIGGYQLINQLFRLSKLIQNIPLYI